MTDAGGTIIFTKTTPSVGVPMRALGHNNAQRINGPLTKNLVGNDKTQLRPHKWGAFTKCTTE
jgi:hypothetical protein